MSSSDPEPEIEPVPEPAEPLPAPPEPEVEPPPPVEENAFSEDVEDLVEPEEVKKKPRKKRRYGWIIVLSAILIFLLVWTMFAPENMPVVGYAYLDDDEYANLGDFNGTVDTWASTTTFGVSISGPSSAAVNGTAEITVLITKVSETLKNGFFQGTSIKLENVSVYIDQGELGTRFLASMSFHEDVGYGVAATVPLVFSTAGNYNLYVHLNFLIYGDMMIGFLPMKSVNVDEMHFDDEFVVS